MSVIRTELKKKIDEWFNLHADEMIADLGKIIAINSVRGEARPGMPYGEASRAVLDVAAEMLTKRGFAADVFEDIILTADLGPAPPKMGILAHLDIVDAGTGWDTDPLTLVEKDGNLYGRGATDNKGPSVAAMYAMYCVSEIFPQLAHGCRIILGSGEESGCEDIAQYIAKVAPPPNVFTPDAGFPIVNTEKGRLAPVFGAKWQEDKTLPRVVSIDGGKTKNVVPEYAEAVVEGIGLDAAQQFCTEYSEKTGAKISASADGDKIKFTAIGKAAHAAAAFDGNNTQTALLQMLSAMPFADSEGFGYIKALNRLFPHGDTYGHALEINMRDEITGDLTVNFGVLKFTLTGFDGDFDSRTPVCADEVDLVGIVTKAFEREGIVIADVADMGSSKSHHTPKDTPFVQSLLQIYEEYTGNKGECLSMGGQTYVHNIPGGVAFGTSILGNENVHSANEFIGKEHLILCAKIFAQVIIDVCGE